MGCIVLVKTDERFVSRLLLLCCSNNMMWDTELSFQIWNIDDTSKS